MWQRCVLDPHMTQPDLVNPMLLPFPLCLKFALMLCLWTAGHARSVVESPVRGRFKVFYQRQCDIVFRQTRNQGLGQLFSISGIRGLYVFWQLLLSRLIVLWEPRVFLNHALYQSTLPVSQCSPDKQMLPCIAIRGSVCLYVYAWLCMNEYLCMSVCVCVLLCACACMCAWVNVSACVCVHARLCACACVWLH